MSDDEIFEDDVIVVFKFDSEHWAFISNQIDFFFDISLLNDDTWLSDWVLTGVYAFN